MQRVTRSNDLDEAIVRAVADQRDVDPAAIEARLVDVVDADKLNALWGPDGDGEVTFEFYGCRVTVTSDGSVDVEG